MPGETPVAATAASGSGATFAQGLDAAMDAVEGAGSSAPESTSKPQQSAQPELEKPPQAGEGSDPRVDPFWERVKSGKVSDNDREMVSRWKRDSEAAKQIQSEMDGLKKSSTEHRAFVETVRKLAAEHKDGEQYLKQYGPEATMRAIIAVRAKGQSTPGETPDKVPADPERDRMAAEIDAIKTRQMQEDFERDLNTSLDKIPDLIPEMREYLAKDEIPPKLFMAGQDQELVDFVKERHDALVKLFEAWSAKKTAVATEKAKQAAAKAKPGGVPASQPARNPSTGKFEDERTLNQRMTASLEDAMAKAFPEDNAV